MNELKGNKECFAHRTVNGYEKCIALKEMKCNNCKFFKTIDEYEDGLKKYPIKK